MLRTLNMDEQMIGNPGKNRETVLDNDDSGLKTKLVISSIK